MRISEVEKLTGISKKNIRFYEEEGLISPGREQGNSYRDYSDNDVDELKRIRLLRRLAVPIDEIRKIKDGRLTLRDCMERHAIYLNSQQRNLEHIKTVCVEIASEGMTLASVNIDVYEEKIRQLDEGGIRFMVHDHNSRRRERRRSAILWASVMSVFFLGFIILIVWAATVDPAPLPLILIVVAIFLAMVLGIQRALKERLDEIERGEEDEAFKY